MKRPLLLLVVAVSGAAVLSLELLGTRLLGPFYGVSLFLWSALISVTLAALAVGYALGGRQADRGADGTRLRESDATSSGDAVSAGTSGAAPVASAR